MQRSISLILMLSISLAAFFAPPIPGKALAAASTQWGGSATERERRAERLKRFLQWTVDDLNLSRKGTEEDVSDLEKQYDSITPLESVQREADLLSLIDTQYSYIDWLKDRIEEFEADQAEITADNLPGSEFLENGFLDIVSMLKEQRKVLDEKIDRFASEENRLAGILERRLLLQSRASDLETRLRHIEKHADENRKDSSEKMKDAERIIQEISVVQRELLALPQVDEDTLRHYRLMIEQGRGASECLALQIDEFAMLREVAALLPRDTTRFATDLERAIHRTVRSYENEIAMLKRRIDGLEEIRDSIPPVGTLLETERSRELSDFYERLQTRYNDLINRIRVRIGAWQAEAAGIRQAGE